MIFNDVKVYDYEFKNYTTGDPQFFGFPGEWFKTRGKNFRITAMVKTENLTGEARIRISNGRGSVGIAGYSGGDPASDSLQYVYSDALTGTNDWTPVTVEFTGLDSINNAVYYATYIQLTATGEGKVWFDNLNIECISE